MAAEEAVVAGDSFARAAARSTAGQVRPFLSRLMISVAGPRSSARRAPSCHLATPRQARFRKWRVWVFLRGYHSRRWRIERTDAAFGLSADVREPLPRLLHAGSTRRCPAIVFVPVVAGGVWLGIDRRALGPARSALLVLAGLVIWTPDRVLAAPPRLPLAAEVPGRRPPPLHHPRRPPRPPQRRDAAGDAPGREHPARRPLLRRSSS